MSRILLCVLVMLLVVVGVTPTLASVYKFQEEPYMFSQFTNFTQAGVGGGSINISGGTPVGNNYLAIWSGGSTTHCARNVQPLATTYWAGSRTVPSSGGYERIVLYDSTLTSIGTWYQISATTDRFEVKISAGTAYIYNNNVEVGTITGLTVNPSYVAFCENQAITGAGGWDDIVYGQNENKYVFDLPETNKFIILKDILNDANDGLFNVTGNTQEDTTYMSGIWARGNTSLEAEYNNETIQLINYIDHTVWHTNYTGTDTSGTVTIDIKTNLIDASAPDGIYVLTIPESGTYSNPITKQSTGGTIYFDRDTYNRGETANVTYEMTPDYWDQSTYTYHLLLIDGLTGERVYDATIPTGASYRTGFFDYTFADDDNIGVYYTVIEGVVTATPTTAYWFAFDYAELSSYMSFYGYVNDGETETPIPGANVTISQYANSVTYAYDSPDGSYNTYGYNLQSGLNTVFNITASGYDQYYVSLTTASARQKYLNFTLEKTPTYGGIAIGGVAREGVLGVDNAVTYGYGAPIEGATVYVYNTTMNETYTVETNTAGWYLCDNNALCYLVNARPYIVQGNKTGFNVSPTYPVTVTGVF